MSIKRAFFATPARTLLTVFLFAVFTGICVKGVNAWNSRITPAKIAAGKTLFERKWIQNDPLCGEGDGLGPVFNANSCVHCHFQGGTGGSGGDVGDVTAFTVVPHANSPVFVFGTVHAEAHKDTDLESRQALSAMYPTLKGEQTNVGGCFITLPDFNPVIFDNIDSPALFGIGKLDDVSNMTIAFHSAKRFATKVSQEFDGNFTGNGVGKSRKLAGGQIGKFGWKAQFATVEDFVAAACANELGLTNHINSQTVPNQHCADKNAKPDMTRQQLHQLVCFVKSLPEPKQILPDDPDRQKRVFEGEKIFGEIGCTDCHVKDFGNVEGVYSDFHLYSLTPPESRVSGYGIPDPVLASFPEHVPDPDEWRTPPLWGVADSAPYMHDGSARTLESAIDKHNGQAQHSRDLFEGLPTDSKQMLLEFLDTLKAPQIDLVKATMD